jgi:hypothetical protein
MTRKWTEDDHAALDALIEKFPLTEIIAKAKQQPISDDQVAELHALADECGADIVKFCRYYKIESLADIKAEDFHRAKEVIETRREGLEKRQRLLAERYKDLKNVNSDEVLFMHEWAEEYPEGSDERRDKLELAHHIYLEGRRKRRGRPKRPEGARDDDANALAMMEAIGNSSGIKYARELAREVIEMGFVQKRGETEKTRIDRLARKFTRMKRNPNVFLRAHYCQAEGQSILGISRRCKACTEMGLILGPTDDHLDFAVKPVKK